MSQQKTMKAENLHQHVELSQNQVDIAVAGVILQKVGSPPPVFKLDTDCWDEVLDFLSVDDVHSFGETCKAFQRVTGKYFQWKYPAYFPSHFYSVPDFIHFSKYIMFERYYESDKEFLSNFKSVKHMYLVDFSLTQPFIDLIKPMLPSLTTFAINKCDIKGDIYKILLKYCVNLENLRIHNNFHKECLLQKYPKLKHIHITTEKPFENDELNTFFKLNPTVRQLTTNIDSIWHNQRSMIKSHIKLDDLTIEDLCGNVKEGFYHFMNDLHKRGFYKRLHVNVYASSPSKHQLAALPSLVTLYVTENVVLPPLVALKELGFDTDLTDLCNEGFNITEISNLCINLERLNILQASVNELLPFICNSPNLREIHIRQLKENMLDLSALNNERKKLRGAQRVTIFVNEDIYLETKWAIKANNIDLVDVQRHDSKEIKQTHGLRLLYTCY